MFSSTDPDVYTLLSWWAQSLPVPELSAIISTTQLGFTPKWITLWDYEATRDTFVPFKADARQVMDQYSSPNRHWTVKESKKVVVGASLGFSHMRECDAVDGEYGMPDPLIEQLIQLDGFTVGARGDSDDMQWQSETVLNNYKTFGRPWEHLSTHIDKAGWERVDVSGNPGRLSFTAGMRMWAGMDVWFGPAAGGTLDYTKVPSIPVGTLTELPNDRWHLHLYDPDEPLQTIRAKQQALRDHLDWDRLEAEAPTRVEAMRTDLGLS